MKPMTTKKGKRPASRRRIAIAVLAAVWALLAACAAQQDNLAPAPARQSPAEARGPAVSRPADGRQGFMITEPARLDEAGRRDFAAAVTLLEEHSDEEAIELLQQVVARSPGVTAPYINLGIAYQRIGNTEQAEAQFKAALERIPDHPVACNQYGLLLRKTGRFEEARRIYEQALLRFPEYCPLHRNLGILFDLYLNDPESALVHYKAYSQARPEDEKVKLWIADVEARLGRN